MPCVFIPLPPESPKAPGYYRSYMTPGLDIDGVCKRLGWEPKIPPGVAVYDEKGGLIQAAPPAEPAAEPEPEKPVEHPSKKGGER